MALTSIKPEGWPAPKGYSNGIVGSGRQLYVAGQVGWDREGRFPEGFVEQFALALDNFLAVVFAAGGRAEDVASMTVFVPNIEAYRRSTKELGAIWKDRMGRHYPAMALIGVKELVDEGAEVEIQGVAVLEDKA